MGASSSTSAGLQGRNLNAEARQVADPLAGPLRIGVIPTLSPNLVPLLVEPVRRAFPRLRPLWVEEKAPAIRRDLEAGVLGTDAFVFAAPKGHPLTRKRGVRATSLTTLAQMVAGGAGVTFLPQLALAQENPHGRLAFRTLNAPAPGS